MKRLTAEQRKVIVEEIIKHESMITTIRRFQARYGTRLCERTVQTNYAKWNVHGTVHIVWEPRRFYNTSELQKV